VPYNNARRTKIVCTIGPSSQDLGILKDMINAGMNLARMNMSHGTHAYHQKTCDLLRQAAHETGKNLGIMLDLQGPKIRTGKLKNHEVVHLEVGQPFCITTRKVVGTEREVSTTYQQLHSDVKPGDSIFMADGILELLVTSIVDQDVNCEIIHGGFLGEHKGINLPGVNVSAPALTPKDIIDLEFAFTLDIDFVALSFVRTADDVIDLKRRIAAAGQTFSTVAKIERPEALVNFAEIVEAADAIMIARGDLGVEIPLNEVPQIQKELISQCNDVGVPVITATQMLESMISSPRPTRAEVADVANSIYDGTDAVMLSGETASGQYPAKTVAVMHSIARDADQALCDNPSHNRIMRMRSEGIRKGRGSYGDAIGQAACRTAHAIEATRIISFTKMGFTAALVARYRPKVPVTAITTEKNIQQRCSIIWGVEALLISETVNLMNVHEVLDRILLDNSLASPGDTVVVAAGVPFAIRTRTNTLKLHTVGGEM
jgi:pyruvate kinase